MFEIFRAKDREAVWLETVSDLVTAHEKMLEHATMLPGRYVVFSKGIGRVVAELETFSPNRYSQVYCN